MHADVDKKDIIDTMNVIFLISNKHNWEWKEINVCL